MPSFSHESDLIRPSYVVVDTLFHYQQVRSRLRNDDDGRSVEIMKSLLRAIVKIEIFSKVD